jgi:hypothetical protein
MVSEPGGAVLATALGYTAAGLAVFPLSVTIDADGHKVCHPVESWPAQSTTDPERIRWWFGPTGFYRDRCVAIDCGKSGLVVIDCDVKHGEAGIDNWAALAAEHGVPATWVAHTPSGGVHLYYRADPDHELRNSVSKLAAGVDVRAAGGFVIAPPSCDPRGEYKWGTEGDPEWAALPTVGAALADAASAPKRNTTGHGGQRLFTFGEARNFIRPHMDALTAARPGCRNDRLNTAALAVSHFVPVFWSRTEAEKMLYDALAILGRRL